MWYPMLMNDLFHEFSQVSRPPMTLAVHYVSDYFIIHNDYDIAASEISSP